MSANHKRPMIAFIVVALLCTFIIVHGVRSEAVVAGFRSGLRVVAGTRLAPQPDDQSVQAPPDRVVLADTAPPARAGGRAPEPSSPNGIEGAHHVHTVHAVHTTTPPQSDPAAEAAPGRDHVGRHFGHRGDRPVSAGVHRVAGDHRSGSPRRVRPPHGEQRAHPVHPTHPVHPPHPTHPGPGERPGMGHGHGPHGAHHRPTPGHGRPHPHR